MTTATYETDFYLWTQQQAALLRQGEFNVGNVKNFSQTPPANLQPRVRGKNEWRFCKESLQILAASRAREELNDVVKLFDLKSGSRIVRA